MSATAPSRPIVICCVHTVSVSAEAFQERILDVTAWSSFRGYGPIPGIRSAHYLLRTPERTGSRIEVHNEDGSRHIEEVLEVTPVSLSLRIGDFSAPVSHLAHHFDERLTFERTHDGIRVVRSMALYPKRALTRPVLWVVSRFLRVAIARHLRSYA